MKYETLEEAAEKYVEINVAKNVAKLMYKEHFVEGAKWQQQQENIANDILNYILTNDDGVGIALGYNSREMIEQHFRDIGYDR